MGAFSNPNPALKKTNIRKIKLFKDSNIDGNSLEHLRAQKSSWVLKITRDLKLISRTLDVFVTLLSAEPL
jgi:hypothetical protein